ncbi:MAG: hypothetical protein K2H46_02535 [Muribaculaceae bacterium]|nr:hypothetical protein [Muribaculaceae bacterium]
MKQQIATDEGQSARLLACGVDPKSADFVWMEDKPNPRLTLRTEIIEDSNPYIVGYGWSLGRLLAMLPKDLMWQGLYYRLVMGPNEYGWEVEYNDLSVLNNLHRVVAENLIEAVVRMIEWLTEEKYKLNEITQ